MSRKNVAGSNITDLVGVTPWSNLQGNSIPEYPFPELPGITVKRGEMVCLSGLVGTGYGITSPGTDASGYGILGFAADNASGITSGPIGIWLVSPNVVFTGNMGHSSTSALAQTAAIDVGQKFGLTSLSGRTYVDKAKAGAASTAMVRVIGLHAQDTHPCFYGKVEFVVFSRNCQLFGGYQDSVSGPTNTVV
jgi:hypothetical protein